MNHIIQRAASASALAAISGLLLPSLIALADDGPNGSELRGATGIWIACGVFVIVGLLGLFWAYRTGQFDGDSEDIKYRMLDVEDPDDLVLTQWRPKPKKRRARGASSRVKSNKATQTKSV